MGRLQTDSADCSIYFNYGRGMAVGDFSASLEMTEGGCLVCPLTT